MKIFYYVFRNYLDSWRCIRNIYLPFILSAFRLWIYDFL